EKDLVSGDKAGFGGKTIDIVDGVPGSVRIGHAHLINGKELPGLQLFAPGPRAKPGRPARPSGVESREPRAQQPDLRHTSLPGSPRLATMLFANSLKWISRYDSVAGCQKYIPWKQREHRLHNGRRGCSTRQTATHIVAQTPRPAQEEGCAQMDKAVPGFRVIR